VFALQVSRAPNVAGGTLSAGNPAIGGNQPSSLRYMHHDHLGSVAVVTNEAGAVLERLAFDPWGKRRNINGKADTTDALVGLTTDRGYTEHEHLDEMGVIHMNGRIYDPLVGRMMSADPFIQAPSVLQSYNRYSYVMNNPLNLTDPSGYWSWPHERLMRAGDRITAAGFIPLVGTGGARQVFNYLQGSGGYQLKSAALGYVSLYCGPWASVCNGGLQGLLAKGYGASDSEAVKAGVNAFVASELNALAGGVGDYYGQYGWQHYLAHAASGVIGLGATQATGGSSWNAATRGIAVTLAGGVGSAAAGGSFANGARTAAYGYLFNALGDHGATQSNSDNTLEPVTPTPEMRASEAALTVLATQAQATVDANCTGWCILPWVRGTLIHSEFRRLVDSLGPTSGFTAEVSYLDGSRVQYGTKGSSRADVVVGNLTSPLIVFDLKTGWAYMSISQAREYGANLPKGTPFSILRPSSTP
jgi:RHS repeat-associated protein